MYKVIILLRKFLRQLQYLCGDWQKQIEKKNNFSQNFICQRRTKAKTVSISMMNCVFQKSNKAENGPEIVYSSHDSRRSECMCVYK